jgi:hypothetical protein
MQSMENIRGQMLRYLKENIVLYLSGRNAYQIQAGMYYPDWDV